MRAEYKPMGPGQADEPEAWSNPWKRPVPSALQPIEVTQRQSLQRLVDAMPAQVAILDAEWRILAVNDAWSDAIHRMQGGSLLQVGQSYRSYARFCYLSGIEVGRDVLNAIDRIDAGHFEQFSTTCQLPSDDRHFHVAISVIHADGVRYATVTSMNVTELVTLRRRSFELGSSLLRAQEEERHRVARDLHDGAAQFLAALNLQLACLREAAKDRVVKDIGDQMSGLLGAFQQELRGMSYLMHPPEMAQCGFHSAVQQLCDGFAARSGLPIDLNIYGGRPGADGHTELTTYRILQEALNNVHKHAQPSRVRVRLCDRSNVVFLMVEDNGIGISPASKQSDIPQFGVGIPGMMARVSELGGRLFVRGRGGRPGTIVGAAVPRPSPAHRLTPS